MEEKRNLTGSIIGSGEDWIKTLSKSELRNFLSLRGVDKSAEKPQQEEEPEGGEGVSIALSNTGFYDLREPKHAPVYEFGPRYVEQIIHGEEDSDQERDDMGNKM